MVLRMYSHDVSACTLSMNALILSPSKFGMAFTNVSLLCGWVNPFLLATCSITLYPMMGWHRCPPLITNIGMMSSLSFLSSGANPKVTSIHPMNGIFWPFAATRRSSSGASIASETSLNRTFGKLSFFHTSPTIHTWEPVSHNASTSNPWR